MAAPTKTPLSNAGGRNKCAIFDPLLGTVPITADLPEQSIQDALSDHPVIIETPGTASLATPLITNFIWRPSGANPRMLIGNAIANDSVLVFDGTTEIGTAITNASPVVHDWHLGQSTNAPRWL